MTDFNWLHLTDLHVGVEPLIERWPNIKDQFFRDIKSILTEIEVIDAVLFTGDLVQSGKPEEYESLDDVLWDMWNGFKELGFDPPCIAIPGNHDLLRPDSGDPDILTLLLYLKHYWSDPDIQDHFWKHEHTEIRTLINKAFKNYQDWWDNTQITKPLIHNGLMPGDISVTIKKEGLKVGFLGLNSAFLQLTQHDFKGNLSIHPSQFNLACVPNGPEWVNQHDLCVLLTHHPSDWLTEDHQTDLAQIIQSPVPPPRFALHIFGHMHEGDFSEIGHVGGPLNRFIQGRSLYGLEYYIGPNNVKKSRMHGYSIGQIHSDDTGLSVRFWPRHFSDGIFRPAPNWIFEPLREHSRWLPIGRLRTNVPHAPAHPDVVIGPLPVGDVRVLYGREEELKKLDEYFNSSEVNIVTIVAKGGVGKTALVQHWLDRTKDSNKHRIEKIFVWSFYREGSGDLEGSADTFMQTALAFFGDQESTFPMSLSQAPRKIEEAENQGRRLAHLVSKTRCLLILDGLETLQHGDVDVGLLKDSSVSALLRNLAIRNEGLCIVTSRSSIKDIHSHRATTSPCLELGYLSSKAGAELLQSLNVRGPIAQLKAASNEYGGHSLALVLLGNYLRKHHHGDITQRGHIDVLEGDATAVRHAKNIMKAYEISFMPDGVPTAELEMLYILGLFDRPVSADCVAALCDQPIQGLTDLLHTLTPGNIKEVVISLRQAGLLIKVEPSQGNEFELDAHPLVREYFAHKLKSDNNSAWCMAHAKLFDYFARLIDNPNPTIIELTPLYRAVYHGCMSNRYLEAYRLYQEQVLQGDRHYSIRILGAFANDLAALSNFFPKGWNEPVDDALQDSDKQALLGSVSYYLMSVGRIRESVIAREAQIKLAKKLGDWSAAAEAAANLVDLMLVMGNLHRADKIARKGIAWSERGPSGPYLHWQIHNQVQLASVLHRLGDINESSRHFERAVTLQKQAHKDNEAEFQVPYLISVQGARYWSFLLDTCGDSKTLSDIVFKHAGDEVMRSNNGLTESALYRWSLGRFYAIHDESRMATIAFNEAVRLIGEARRIDFRPRVLLQRASLSRSLQEINAAMGDLEEALDIATSSHMKLYIAEGCLLKGNLWVDIERLTRPGFYTPEQGLQPPEARPMSKAWEAYQRAAALINEMDYGLRRAELSLLKIRLHYYGDDKPGATALLSSIEDSILNSGHERAIREMKKVKKEILS